MLKFVEHKSHNLSPPKRYISGFDNQGRSVINESIDANIKWIDVSNDYNEHSGQFSLVYATKGFPIDISESNDIDFYKKSLENGVSITISGGSVMRVVDMAPGSTSPMHRTTSIDYGIVLRGQVEAIMDSGDSVLLNKDDIFVQRGTMHAWRNTSETEYARMIYILMSSKPIEVNGKTLKEDLGGINGVPRNE